MSDERDSEHEKRLTDLERRTATANITMKRGTDGTWSAPAMIELFESRIQTVASSLAYAERSAVKAEESTKLQFKAVYDIVESHDMRYQQRWLSDQQNIKDALAAAKESTANALTAAKEAVLKSEAYADKRAIAQNEFRAQLDDQAKTFASKSEVEPKFAALTEKNEAIVKQMTLLIARTEVDARITGIADRVDAIGKQMSFFVARVEYDALLARHTELDKRFTAVHTEASGRSSGIGQSWAVLLGGVGLISTLIAIASAIFVSLKQ